MQHLPPEARASRPDECPCGRFATGRCKFCRVGFCDVHADLVEDQFYCAACDAALHAVEPAAPAPVRERPRSVGPRAAEPAPSAVLPSPRSAPAHQAAPAHPPALVHPDPRPAPSRAESRPAPPQHDPRPVRDELPQPAPPPPPEPEPDPEPSAPEPEPWRVAYESWEDGFIRRMTERVSGSGKAGLVLTTLGAELVYHSQNPDVQAGVTFSIGWIVRVLPVTAASYATGQHLILPDDVFPAGGIVTTYRQGDRVEAVFDPTYAGPLFGQAVAEEFMGRMKKIEAQLNRLGPGVAASRR